MQLSQIDLLICGLVLAVTATYIAFTRRRRGPLPPGPKGLPLIGNILDMPSQKTWEAFGEWADKWGPITSITVLGQPIIMISKVETAIELLDRRSSNYSERPRLIMGGEIVGYDKTTPLLPYGAAHRASRAHFSRLIGSNDALKRFTTVQEEESHKFLKRLLDHPKDIEHCLRQTAGSLILRITYGITVQDPKDIYVDLIDHATHQFSQLIAPGAFFVDVIPALRYVPEWLGATFKAKARLFRQGFLDMLDKPYAVTEAEVNAGTAQPSFTGTILQDGKKMSDEDVYALKCTAASLYAGAADTTIGVLYGFFLAMCLFPEVQKTAQEEIDRVVGTDRLPTMADRSQLPYVSALAKEAFRWHTVGPTGVPHCVKEDDMYNGYFIPKGSIVFACLWKMASNEDSYPDPNRFDPTRHMNLSGKPAQPDPAPFMFGFGRRKCPGSFLADQSVYIEIAMALAALRITPSTKDGALPQHRWKDGAISHPEPFEYDLQPRSEKHRAMILRYYEELPTQ